MGPSDTLLLENLDTSSLQLLLGSLWPGVVLPVWILSIAQIELGNCYYYIEILYIIWL